MGKDSARDHREQDEHHDEGGVDREAGMSKPKYSARRLGFAADEQGRPRSLSRNGIWTDAIRHEARWTYLQVVARDFPAVLTSLRDLPNDDDLPLWAATRGLLSTDPNDEWGLAHAQATRAALAKYQPAAVCWFDRNDLTGTLCDDHAPGESRPLKHDTHFVWLARFQSGIGWKAIATDADIKTIREAVRLAQQLRLRLRDTRRGRPRRANSVKGLPQSQLPNFQLRAGRPRSDS